MRKKTKAKRCVRFADDTKSWDGQRQEHILLENLVKDYFSSAAKNTVLDDLIDNENAKMLLVLHELLLAAVERVKRNAVSMLITNGSGGCYGIRLRQRNVSHLKKLIKDVHSAYDAVRMPALLAAMAA